MQDQSNRAGQGGSGSAEQQGRPRSDQQHPHTDLSKDELKDVAQQGGLGRKRLADLDDLGALSGRDDASGGSGDRMEEQSSNQPTDR